MDEKLTEMPLVELHLHLDGAVGIDKSFEILNLYLTFNLFLVKSNYCFEY